MNLVKIADMLKNASDQNLVQEMQNPSGSVPSYMVLSELDRRKKLRGSLMNDEPQKSVAEDLEAESAQAPQMGLGSLGQAPQAQQPQQAPVGMASGGDVSSAQMRADIQNTYGVDPTAAGAYDPRTRKYKGRPVSSQAEIDAMRAYEQAKSSGYAQGGEVKHFFNGNEVYTSEPGWNPFAGFSMPDFTGKAGWSDEQEQLYKDLVYTGMTPEQAKAKVFGTPAPVTPATAAPTSNQPQAAPPAPAPSGPARFKAPAAPAASSGAGNYSVSGLMDELKGYRKEMADAYKQQADVYKQQADEIKNAKSSDVAMALMQAGFGVMGGQSQNAAVNIGQGALPALQQYAGMDRARREQLQKLAMGQGALGIESLRARMEGARGEGELGLKERAVGADEMKARAAMQSAGAQSSYYKQAIAQAKSENDAAKIAASVINSSGFSMMDPADQKFFLGMAKTGLQNRFPSSAAPSANIAGTYNPKTGRIE